MARHVVAAVRDLPPGSRRLVTVGNRAIALFNVGGEYFAILNRCPHQGGSLCDGRLIGLVESSTPGDYVYSRPGEIVRCPWHGWEFDLRTGKSRCDPERLKVKSYDVAVEPGDRLLGGDHVAETFEVRVENDYVVIEA